MSETKLGDFLREVSNWRWDAFWAAERDKTYTSNEAIIFGLIRACAGQNLQAIKMSLNRLDGKLKTPVRVEYPKIYTIYPFATEADVLTEPENVDTSLPSIEAGDILPSLEVEEPEVEVSDLPSMSLRETLTKMADYPRETPELIITWASEVELALRTKEPMPVEIPMVKSVVAANLLTLAQKRNMEAMSEVFDQIDGKLAETIQILGEDIVIVSYLTTAPAGAYKNEQGVWQIEAKNAQDSWAAKLGKVIDI